MQRATQVAFVAALAVAFTWTSIAFANSCSNLTVIGTYDESGLREDNYGIYAVGTFRIEGESDESKQPMFNLATISCEKQIDDAGKDGLVCKVIQASAFAHSEKPNAESPNCSLDLDVSDYPMRELQKGILTGIEPFASGCFNSILTIDRNTKRVYQSFTKAKGADNLDKIRPGTCSPLPATMVLMNCTAYPRIRQMGKQDKVPPRYCDFSKASDR